METKSKILAVDDNSTNLAIIEELLGESYELKTVLTGREALELISQFRPDVILLDIMMPDIDGYEVCKQIRSETSLCHTKIIMVSAKVMVSERLKGYEVGADDYITKPFDEAELLAKVRVYLRLKSMEEVNQLKTNVLTLLQNGTITPLNCLIRPAKQLMSDRDMSNDERKGLARELYCSVKRLHTLFDKVLTLSAIKSGKWTLSMAPVNLYNVISESISEVRTKASKRNITIESQIDEKLMVMVDRKEILMVVTSLLDNAVEFSRKDSVVNITASGDSVDAYISVTNQGEGIDKEFLPHIFDEFASSEIPGEGQGLSLAIARWIVLEHKGRIDVVSEKGQGTTFTVRLPLVSHSALEEESVLAGGISDKNTSSK